MSHVFTFEHENTIDIYFSCSICGQVLGFNKPGLGEPHAIPNGASWDAPDDHDKYIGPCNE